MPRRSLAQTSFFDPQVVAPNCLEPGSVAWVLAHRRDALFPAWLLKGWRGGGLGRNAWPASVLMTLVLLRWTEEGMSRLASVRRARTDMAWRAAMGLALSGVVPSERTLRDFEKFMREPLPGVGRARFQLFHENVVRLCIDEKVVGESAIWTADSTPMWCYGAVLDTVRLLGDGLRKLAKIWTKATRTPLPALAERWQAAWLLAKSTKGGLAIDWRDAQARADGLDRLARDVLRVVEHVRGDFASARPGFRKSAAKLCMRLSQVVRDDLETDEQGRLVVARRVASDRLVSLTDPQARHGRKSKSRTFNGFKLHLVGDVVSGVIASLAVTPGNQHDNVPAHRLIRRACDLIGGIRELLADTAYGAATFRRRVRAELGVDLVAPPPAATKPKNDHFGKADFEIDFSTGVATCPNGVAATRMSHIRANGGTCRRYGWHRSACDACPLRDRCLARSRRTRTLLLHPDEEEQRRARQQWSKPETKKRYRIRAQCERLINQMVRHGARRARAWGLGFAQLQAHAIATVCNLKLLA